jgi:hypothetical protein
MKKILAHEAKVAAADKAYYARLNKYKPPMTAPIPTGYKELAIVASVLCAATFGFAYKKLRKKYRKFL